jgi:hypothetical protein
MNTADNQTHTAALGSLPLHIMVGKEATALANLKNLMKDTKKLIVSRAIHLIEY